MGFGDYLYDLLSRPYKTSAEVKAFASVIGSLLDEAKAVLFAVRRVWFLRTTPVELLSEFGTEFDMPRLTGETDQQYRTRLINAFDWYYWMGTNYGIMRSIGYVLDVQCQIREYQVDCWKLGRSRLGRNTRLFSPSYYYVFGLLFERQLTPEEEQLVTKVVNLVKPAHVIFKLRYPLPEQQIYWRMGRSRLTKSTILATKGVSKY